MKGAGAGAQWVEKKEQGAHRCILRKVECVERSRCFLHHKHGTTQHATQQPCSPLP